VNLWNKLRDRFAPRKPAAPGEQRLKCRPGDLAIVVDCPHITRKATGERVDAVRVGAVVQVLRILTDGNWELAEPVRMRHTFSDGMTASWDVIGINDSMLQPIRNPGEKAVDEMVAKVGPAPSVVVPASTVQERA